MNVADRLYRATIVDADDPEQRNRYRVFVFGVHQTETMTYDVDAEETAGGAINVALNDTPRRVAPPTASTAEMLSIKDGKLSGVDQYGAGHEYYSADVPAAFAFAERFPWAEVCAPSGKGAGFFPVYAIGDVVWVFFEGGDIRLPVILGGIATRSYGMTDLPAERGMTERQAIGGSSGTTRGYEETRRKWTWTDRVGNMVELSEVPDERYVRLVSGRAEFMVTATDDSFRATTPGTFGIDAPTFSYTGTGFFVLSDANILLEVAGEARSEVVNIDGEDFTFYYSPLLALYSSWGAELCGKDQTMIGHYLDRGTRTDEFTYGQSRNIPRRSRYVGIGGRTVHLGFGCLDALKSYSTYATDDQGNLTEDSFLPTQHVRVESTDTLLMHVGLAEFRPDLDDDPTELPDYCNSSSSSQAAASSESSSSVARGYAVLTAGRPVFDTAASEPTGRAASAVPYRMLDLGDMVLHASRRLYLWADEEVIFPPGAVTFPVLVQSAGGSGGDASTPASFIYDIYSIDGTKLYGSAVTMTFSRPTNGPSLPATYGIAYIDQDGFIQLAYVDERMEITP